ncbi:Uncharacterised protein [Serratia quinivorans]|nr:Uncharacterised protein [Serratia quinivorans]
MLNEKLLFSLAILLLGMWLLGLAYEEDVMRILAEK